MVQEMFGKAIIIRPAYDIKTIDNPTNFLQKVSL